MMPSKILQSPYLTSFGSSEKGKEKLDDDVRLYFPFKGCEITYQALSNLIDEYKQWVTKGLLKNHANKDCGLYVATFAEFLSDQHKIPPDGFLPEYLRNRYGALLWSYGSEKGKGGYVSENDDPLKPKGLVTPPPEEDLVHIEYELRNLMDIIIVTRFHHGGKFVEGTSSGGLTYIGKSEVEYVGIDKDHFSLMELFFYARDMGYFTVGGFYFKDPTTNNFVLVDNNFSLLKLIKDLGDGDFLDLYIQHVVDEVEIIKDGVPTGYLCGPTVGEIINEDGVENSHNINVDEGAQSENINVEVGVDDASDLEVWLLFFGGEESKKLEKMSLKASPYSLRDAERNYNLAREIKFQAKHSVPSLHRGEGFLN
uniref:Ulp1 protease family, C-terminal catalytic domain containing protein n=1 Tax=Solanum tuberosum TaxID=4113 RepID=M1DE70_SOLTU